VSTEYCGCDPEANWVCQAHNRTMSQQDVRRAVEQAFKAGYHCQWLKDEMRYVFDPQTSPGDPDGAFHAWLIHAREGK